MSYVVSLTAFAPPPRYDAAPWARVHVEEAAGPNGPWVEIDDQALAPLDPDPRVPQARDVTTSNATLTLGWYRLIFFDGSGGQSQPSDPVRNAIGDELLPPSPDAVRNQSPLLREKFPIPNPDQFAVHDLRTFVYESTALVESFTWRLIDPSLGDPAPEGYLGEPVPPALVPVAFEAIARMSERMYVTAAPKLAKQIATGRRLAGFSAGPYSEHYFAPGEFARRGVMTRPAMDQDETLDALLWSLATEDARDYHVWRQTGQPPPTGVASAFNYRRQGRGYFAGALRGPIHGAGPDGW